MKKAIMILIVCSVFLTGCTFTEVAGEGNSAIGAKAHLNTTGVGLKFLFSDPITGSPTIDDAVNGLTTEAKAMGSSSVRIVQSGSTNLWWILPPFSIIINPVITNVAADAN